LLKIAVSGEKRMLKKRPGIAGKQTTIPNIYFYKYKLSSQCPMLRGGKFTMAEDAGFLAPKIT
jgi:hypothetical protein